MHKDTIKPITFRITTLAALLFFILTWSSCKKEAGEGGLATISGKVYGYDINSSGVVTDSGYVGDVQVFISYGDNTFVDDNVRTSYSGEYSFRGLQKGKYTLFVYTECDTCNFNQAPVIQHFEVTSNKQDAVLPDFVIYN